MKIYILSMANKWVPTITNPEAQLNFLFDCTGLAQNSEELEIIELMDNNDWQPNLKTQRYMENFVGAMRDDWALRFKCCVYKGKTYVAAYFSAIHYVFEIV